MTDLRPTTASDLDVLRGDPRVDSCRMAVMGCCIRGSGALEAAWVGADVAGVVSVHDGLGTGPPPNRAASTPRCWW